MPQDTNDQAITAIQHLLDDLVAHMTTDPAVEPRQVVEAVAEALGVDVVVPTGDAVQRAHDLWVRASIAIEEAAEDPKNRERLTAIVKEARADLAPLLYVAREGPEALHRQRR